jgi:pimeloyl-ACP methyl ester carboxylesterase
VSPTSSNAAGPTSSPERTVLSTDRQAGSGTPESNAAGPTSLPETNETSLAPLIALPFPEDNQSFTTDDGVVVQTYDWGGDGPPLVLAHATGLHAHVWLPLVQRLRSSFHCYAIDARAQGDTTAPPGADVLIEANAVAQELARNANAQGSSAQQGATQSASDLNGANPAPNQSSNQASNQASGFAWANITKEYTKAMDIWGLSGRGDVFGFGHSQGGYALLSAALERPGTFAHVFGFEPVIFLAPKNAVVGNPMDNFMANNARKRREVFASKQEAYENYRAKLPFKMADDDVTRSYVHWGFEDLPDGGVRLKCRAAWEGELFSLSMSDLYHRLPAVDCPVTLGLGEFTSDAFNESVPLQHAQMPNSSVMHFPGRSHFGPLENTDEMAAVIRTSFLGQ